MDTVRQGIYRHYKGPLYQVLGLAHDANSDTLGEVNPADPRQLGSSVKPLTEREVVVYIALQLDDVHQGYRMVVRSLSDWNAFVHNEEGTEYGTICKHWVSSSSGSFSFCWCNGEYGREIITRRFSFLGERYVQGMKSS